MKSGALVLGLAFGLCAGPGHTGSNTGRGLVAGLQGLGAEARRKRYRRIFAGKSTDWFFVFIILASMSRDAKGGYYRADGVRIQHDPWSSGMAEKYGNPGQTDDEGFDPYADSVGPGIYGGKVKRDPTTGQILIGTQYQNHNPEPGPIYAGGGYTDICAALGKSPEAVAKILDRDPSLVNEISTGGAQPLHMAGMSQRGQLVTDLLIQRGADIEAQDTYGYRPIHRMASNNLAVGARALLLAGADANAKTQHGETPMSIAKASHAMEVVQVLREFQAT